MILSTAFTAAVASVSKPLIGHIEGLQVIADDIQTNFYEHPLFNVPCDEIRDAKQHLAEAMEKLSLVAKDFEALEARLGVTYSHSCEICHLRFVSEGENLAHHERLHSKLRPAKIEGELGSAEIPIGEVRIIPDRSNVA